MTKLIITLFMTSIIITKLFPRQLIFRTKDPFGNDPFRDAFEGEQLDTESFFSFPSSGDPPLTNSDPWGGAAANPDGGLGG